MKKYQFVVVSVFVFFACSIFSSDLSKKEILLEKLWETLDELKQPESVVYDPERNIIYVSNIDGEPANKDGKGFISKLTLDGKFIESEKLEYPNGLAIQKKNLIIAAWGVPTDGFATKVQGNLKIISLKDKNIVSIGDKIGYRRIFIIH
ncbi:hypothetical protein HZA55_05070 [Candidatus Poribacteria bacterium]|nr:hypothetical protein [Candidatus Poribacteria bacterium]